MRADALRERYDPLTLPRPERAERWLQTISYQAADRLHCPGVDLVRYRVPAKAAAVGGRIVFASDFHFAGTARDLAAAEQAVERIAGFRPDLLLLGGDLSADAIDIGRLPQLLKLLEKAAPVRIAVHGNWERGKHWLGNDYWRALYRDYGIELLCNEFHTDSRFNIYGCDELTAGRPRLPAEWPAERFNLLLVHRPDTVVALDSGRGLRPVDLALAGHTHGGQVRIPGIGPVFASSRYRCRFAYGEFRHRKYDTRMIVSGGVGQYSFPFRFRCRPEVLGIELVQS